MPIARFRLEDGRIARFNVPEGTTPEQAQAQFQEMLSSGALEAPQETQEQRRARFQREEMEKIAAEQSPLQAAMVGAGRGLASIGRGLGLVEKPSEIEQSAIEALRSESPIATGAGEILGQAAPFIVPGMGAAGLAGTAARVGATAGLGALEGGIIARGEGGDIGEQLLSAGIGGTVAGALELALPVVGRIGGKIVRRVLGKAPKGAVIDSAGRPSQELLDALAESGQTFDDVVREAQSELSGKVVEPRQAARKAFFESQGLKPTKAQISRNAADFQAQQEAAKTSSRVRDALEKQEAYLTSRFDNAVLETGGQASSPTSTVFDSLTEKATRLDQEIGDLYSAAREVIPKTEAVPMSGTASRLKQLMESDRRAGGNISALIGDMKNKGLIDNDFNITKRATVDTAEEVRKLANELYDPANPFGNMLLRQVKDAVDDDVFKTAGKDFYKQARDAKAAFERDLSRAKISKFDSRKANLVRDVLENKIDPDQLVDKVVFGKSWRDSDLKQLKDYISTEDAGKKAFDDMRAEVMQKIKDMSFIGPVDESGVRALSRDKLQKAISSIGQKKMNVLFTKDEQKFLKDMLEIAKLREPVRGTAMGRGPSAQAIGRLEQKLKDLPVIGSLIDFINVDAQGRAVLKAAPERVKPVIERNIPLAQARQALALPAAAAAQQEQQ